MHGGHLLLSLSNTQSLIALASADAELYAMAAAASEGLGAKDMRSDFGVAVEVYLHVDASAAVCVAQRNGARENTTPRHTTAMDTRRREGTEVVSP